MGCNGLDPRVRCRANSCRLVASELTQANKCFKRKISLITCFSMPVIAVQKRTPNLSNLLVL